MQGFLLRTIALATLLLFGLAWLGSLLESAEHVIEALLRETRAEDESALHNDLAEAIVLSRLQNEGVTMESNTADEQNRPAFQYQAYKSELEAFARGRGVRFTPYEKMSLIYVAAHSEHEMSELRQIAADKAVQP